ncbi:MAG: hypothetical protein Q8L23_13535 [Caulobacter sp.]|nr:hypothetical protein [Caulobacter sp.]
MQRRDFIRVLGGGAIFAATGCAPAGVDPRAAWVDPGAGETDVRRKALSWAILAPNPHNMQPWIVDLSVPDQITLYIDRTRLLPVTDPFNRQITIGCGGFLELLIMALSERGGLASTVELFPEGEAHPVLDDRPLFRVSTHPQGATPAPLFGNVLQRRTNRGPFTNREVDQAAASNLLGAFKSLEGVACNVTTAPDRIARLRELVYRGAHIEAHTPPAHHESVERTFIGARDVALHPWGVSLDQPVMTAMNAAGILTKSKMATPGTTAFKESLKFLKTAADTSQGFLWITTAADTRAEQITAGRAYLLANLAATKFGLAMHPWSQGLQEYATQKPVYDALHKDLAPGGGRIQMLARIGYPKAEIPPAPRRGLAAQLRKV